MKTKFSVKSIIAGAILGAGVVLTIGAAATGSRVNWDYRVIQAAPGEAMESSLNSAGTEGWEAVGVTTAHGNITFTILKRAKK